MILAGIALLVLLAVIAWAAAWQTMHWLAEAEDLVEELARWLPGHPPDRVGRQLEEYRRRTPRRRAR